MEDELNPARSETLHIQTPVFVEESSQQAEESLRIDIKKDENDDAFIEVSCGAMLGSSIWQVSVNLLEVRDMRSVFSLRIMINGSLLKSSKPWGVRNQAEHGKNPLSIITRCCPSSSLPGSSKNMKLSQLHLWEVCLN